MPMRWTPEKDQTLLLKILETSKINVDTSAIANLWPAKDGEARPTARAITERLVRIRELSRASGTGGGFSVSKGPKTARASGPTGVSKPAAPRKPRAKKEEQQPAGSVKVEHDDVASSSFCDLPELMPNSSGGFSSIDGSQPATPAEASGGHKRHADLMRFDGVPRSYDPVLDTPSKKFKASSFPGLLSTGFYASNGFDRALDDGLEDAF